MRFAKIVFIAAGVWGIIVLTPLYFLLDVTGRQYAPPTSYPQFFYGFLAVAIAWQIAFLVIGSNPARFRLLMIPSTVEKLGYVVTVAVLYGQARISSADAAAAVPDAVLGIFFAAAFVTTVVPTWRGRRVEGNTGDVMKSEPSPASHQEAQVVRVELDTVIARPIDDVFGRLTDLSGYSRWMPRLGVFIKSRQTSEGPVGVGTTYYDKGWMGTFLGEIVEFHAPTRVTFKEKLRWLGVTVMEARPAYELVSTRTGTEVHHTADGRLFGIFNVMKPVVAWMARGERRRTVRALRDSLEQRH